ncbi:MAG: COX15/CtaA family protein, partial [Acidimicrobiales bacterium]|nr:COX15/CtaA family protein [Acidimicrobiales bacterium]
MRVPTLSPPAYRRVTLFALLALAFIVVTGGAVRLTGSGLGCPDWPTCAENRVVAPWEYHAMVEFVNRTITGLVSMAVMLAVLGSLVRRPRRRDLLWLSVGLVAGVLGQIVLGGLTVLFHLTPGFVMAHFLLSMVLIANAVVLHHR